MKELSYFAIFIICGQIFASVGCSFKEEHCKDNDLCIKEASCLADTSYCRRWNSALTASRNEDWQNAKVGVPYLVEYQASGGFPPYTWILNDGDTSTHPAWLALTWDENNSEKATLRNTDDQHYPDKPTHSDESYTIKITVMDNTKHGYDLTRTDNSGFSISEELTITDCQRSCTLEDGILAGGESKCISDTSGRECPIDSYGCAQLVEHECTNNHGATTCGSGKCIPTCTDLNWNDCDGNPNNGCETDLRITTAHCGSCNIGCTNANGDTQCSTSVCSPTCSNGFSDCDGNPNNGCETDLRITAAHCGSCNKACTNDNGSTQCLASVCSPTCNTGFSDCDGDPSNGCETDLNTVDGCNGRAASCSFIGGNKVCNCDPAYIGDHCNACAPGALGNKTNPDCFNPASADYCLTSQCFMVTPTEQTSCYYLSTLKDCSEIGGSWSSLDCQNESGTVDYCGQDAQYQDNLRGYSVSKDGNVVSDTLTGLVWQLKIPNSSSDKKNWADAKAYCDTTLKNANYGGFSDWRLPNVFELQTLVDYGVSSHPATDTTIFSDMPPPDNPPKVKFWSSSERFTDQAWYMDFYDGTVNFDGANSYYQNYTRCVRGGQTPTGAGADADRFIQSHITYLGTSYVVVTDSVTGLMWQKNYDATGEIWIWALKYCEDSDYGGYTDWRLPNVKELSSLIKYTAPPTYPATDFPEMPNAEFWTSSTYMYNTTYAWTILFTGYVSYSNKSMDYSSYIRCVRGAPWIGD